MSEKLYIPVKAKKKQLIEGFGPMEWLRVGFMFFIGILVSVIVGLKTKNVFFVVITITAFGFIGVLLFQKNRYNKCFYDLIMKSIRNSNTQKEYVYKHYNKIRRIRVKNGKKQD